MNAVSSFTNSSGLSRNCFNEKIHCTRGECLKTPAVCRSDQLQILHAQRNGRYTPVSLIVKVRT